MRRCVNKEEARTIAQDATSLALGPELAKVGKELDVRLQVLLVQRHSAIAVHALLACRDSMPHLPGGCKPSS